MKNILFTWQSKINKLVTQFRYLCIQFMTDRPQTQKEEFANATTHGLGILFALIGIPALITQAVKYGNGYTVFAVSMFCFGISMVYLSSTIYHAVQHQRHKHILRIWDHISIYFLIGGSYTAVIQKFIASNTAIIFLGIMWSIIVVASVLKVFHVGKRDIMSTVLYLGLGWMAVFLIKPLIATMPLEIFIWLLAGGLFYTGGVYFYIKRWPYSHAVWHLFVLAGTVSHYFAVYKMLPLNLSVK
jgi:hemolysin III